MKTLHFSLACCFLSALPLLAQVPYQGRLTDAAGAPVNGAATVRFSLYPTATGGAKTWGDQTSTVNLIDGRFSVTLGPDPDAGGVGGSINTAVATGRFLQIQVGSDPPLPRQEILATPRSLFADTALNATTAVNATTAARLNAGADSYLNFRKLYLHQDTNHGLGFNALPGAVGIDGPVLFGYSQGGLGTVQNGQRMALTWNSTNDVSVGGRLIVNSSNNVATANNAEFFSPNVGPNYSYIHWGATGDIYWRSARADGKVILQDQGGNVAIGTNAPSSKLHVRVEANDGNPALLKLQRSGTDIQNTEKSADWSFRIQNNKNLELFYLGTFLKGWFTESDGVYRTASDRRLKEDITPLASVLDRVLKLEPVSYHFKSSPDAPEKSVGFIAQDVQPLFPEVVSQSGEYFGVGYSEFAPITVAAIKELNTKLEKENADLRARLDRLEAALLKGAGALK